MEIFNMLKVDESERESMRVGIQTREFELSRSFGPGISQEIVFKENMNMREFRGGAASPPPPPLALFWRILTKIYKRNTEMNVKMSFFFGSSFQNWGRGPHFQNFLDPPLMSTQTMQTLPVHRLGPSQRTTSDIPPLLCSLWSWRRWLPLRQEGCLL